MAIHGARDDAWNDINASRDTDADEYGASKIKLGHLMIMLMA